MKFIHVSEMKKYFENSNFQPIYSPSYPIPIDKLRREEIGRLGKDRIVVKKLTKKEEKEIWEKDLEGLYKFLEGRGIDFVKFIEKGDGKVLIGKFMGIEMWIKDWRKE